MENNTIGYYNTYDEDGRLFRNNSHQIEWLTTIHYFNRIIPAHSRIFDGCAGTGNYAFQLAEQGHDVVASDLVPHNVDIMRCKQSQKPLLENIFAGDICKTNHYGDQSFDIVLCMGAFYHLDEQSRCKAMDQCLRLLKKDGILVITYINLMAALYVNMKPKLENMEEILKCYDTKSPGDSFIYMRPQDIEQMAREYRLKTLHHLSSDGITYLIASSLNLAAKDNFDNYMNLHLKTCEQKDLLGYGLHGLVFLRRSRSI